MNRADAAAIARTAKAEKAPSLHDRFWSKVNRGSPDECWLWTAAVRKKTEGYGAFWFMGRHVPAARMALILSGMEVPDGMVVCHACDNPPCCNPAHLFVGTHIDNNKDKVQKRRHAKMEKIWTAKLSACQVEAIRREVLDRKSKRGRHYGAREVADRYGVSVACVNDVVANRSWRGA